MTLRFFEDAAAEVERERQWYLERSPKAMAVFLREVDGALFSIVEAPRRWPEYLAGTRRYVLPTFPFSIIYFEDGSDVLIVAVAHERRRPGYWRGRLPE